MSSGTRSSRSGSSSNMEDIISVTITATEVESIVHKVVSQAVTDVKELFNSKLEALESCVKTLEDRLSELENSSVSNGSEQSQVQTTTEQTTEIQSMRSETRESLLASNDNEQYRTTIMCISLDVNQMRERGLSQCCSSIYQERFERQFSAGSSESTSIQYGFAGEIKEIKLSAVEEFL